MEKREVQQYFDMLSALVKEAFSVAKRARSQGYDPSDFPEIIPAEDVASRVEGLLGPPGIGNRIRELLKDNDREIVAFKIVEELIMGKFGYMSDEEVADKALRVALAILTEGITAGPLEGIAEVRIKKNFDGSKYLAVYYAGPIRAAGGTEAAQTVLIADFIRQLLNLKRYVPTSDEIARYVEEIELYERHVTHLQYSVSKEEVEFAVSHLPIEITGEATDQVEVSGYRDLPRVETNRLRGGAILVLSEGVIGRANKLLKIVETHKIPGWEWLRDLVILRSKLSKSSEKEDIKSRKKIAPDYKYLSDVIGGRPVFSYPSRVGGFRIRYGRSRNTGLSAVGMHPATMFVLKEFIAPGTHIRTERPGKGAVVLPVTTISGPIVRLKNGTVKKINDLIVKSDLLDEIDVILFLGDILIAFGEFLENNHKLLPSNFVEEWWVEELKSSLDKEKINLNEISMERIKKFISSFENVPTFSEALYLTKKLKIPLHPKYTYFWNNISEEDLFFLREFFKHHILSLKEHGIVPFDIKIKTILEKLFIEHELKDESIILNPVDTEVILTVLALDKNIPKNLSNLHSSTEMDTLTLVSKISGLPMRDPWRSFIGARMGRPEKAKERKMSPPVHSLFPVGLTGGRTRNLIDILKYDKITIEAVTRICPKCGLLTPEPFCRRCNTKTVAVFYCSKCKITTKDNICPRCGTHLKPFAQYEISPKMFFENARRKTNAGVLKKVKCVLGLTSANKIPEILEKGILRAKHDVYVFKDGTIRFDSTDAPLTHFKPKEIGVSVEKLKELGYTHDYLGNPLTSEDQILELKVQDIIVSKYGLEYLLRVSKFIDDLLENVYHLPRFYNASKIEDLIGHLVIGLAPHTSAGIIGRIIGFTDANVGFAHPYWHAAKRRNCDGDEDSIILLLDGLLNFSKAFLPKKRGGMMDAPLVLTILLNPLEVDDESWSMDICSHYPLEFYHRTYEYADPKEVVSLVDIVEKRLGTDAQYYGFKFTHPTERIDLGPKKTAYKRYKTMQEKLRAQLQLAEEILAVDAHDVAKKVLISHFLPDILGSLRSFATQGVRCVKCNARYRRPPLIGRCLKCGNKLVLTVPKGTVVKYLGMAKEIVEKYNLGNYLKQRIIMIEQSINSIFAQDDKEPEPKNQAKLSDFLG